MSEGELQQEAMDRLERKMERMGIVAPDEEFSHSELREMYLDELRDVYGQERDQDFKR